MSTGEFSVYQFFPDDSYEEVLRFVSAERAMTVMGQLSRSLGARVLKTTRRIIITDGGDMTVAEWTCDAGFTFPPQLIAAECYKSILDAGNLNPEETWLNA